MLKSEIEIAPVFHRLPERIRAHALICFLALVLYRVLRMRLKANNSPYSPEHALEVVRRIQFHQVTLHQRQAASGLKQDKHVERLFAILGPRYKDRQGGYVRILKAGFRYGDMAPMAIIELVDRDTSAKGAADKARTAAEEASES